MDKCLADDERILSVLDLCAGTGSATKAFIDRGHNVDTLDIIGNQTYNIDVRYFSPYKKYDFIWASPPCTCFSIAAVGYHWNNGIPNPETLEAIEITRACVSIALTAKYHVIENPMCMMRKLDFMIALAKKEYNPLVTYCQYGDNRMKPSDLWHNIDTFIPKKCKNGSKCHPSTPRGSHNTGTQSLKNAEERGKIPYRLSLEICKAVEKAIYNESM